MLTPTSSVRAALDETREFPVEVRAEDTDVLVMLIHHVADHPIILTTSKETSYDAMSERSGRPSQKDTGSI